MRGRSAVLALALVLAAATGCQTPWILEEERPELVRTDVRIESGPPGAMVSLNGVQQDRAPLIIPIEYHHVEQLWARQNNAGAAMREDWPVWAQVIGFPVWGIASFFHFAEENRRHVYGANRHVVSAYLRDHRETIREITLEGEDSVTVDLVLEKLGAAGE